MMQPEEVRPDHTPRPRWSPLQKTLHWSVVGLCFAQIPTAWAIGRTHVAHQFGLPQQPFDLVLHEVHAINGGIIFIAALARLALRWRTGPVLSALPVDRAGGTPQRWLAPLAGATHLGLYALILALPVSGFLAMYITGSAAPVHRAATRMLLGLATLHAGAALFHAVVLRDAVLAGMLPGWRGREPGRGDNG